MPKTKKVRNRVVEILMRRDGISERDAESRLEECRRICDERLAVGDYDGVEEAFYSELGLELDYLYDVLD